MSALQDVPLRINEPVLEAIKRHRSWLIEKHKLKLERELRPNKVARALTVYKSILEEDIATAENLKGAPFRLPASCDYRGRVYGNPHLNFQRQDYVRALFLFDRGQPIATDVDRATYELVDVILARHMSNLGVSGVGEPPPDGKINWLEPLKWADKNDKLICQIADGNSDEWMEAKEPFMFLAACIEWRAIRRQPGHLTRLPVSFDATCSGYQHICAMTRDADGAALVNLNARSIYGTPNDIYIRAAQKVGELIKASRDPDLVGIKIDRDLVKQPVMTYGYGATHKGMEEQVRKVLQERGFDKQLEDRGKNWKARAEIYRRLVKYILQAIGEIFPKAAKVRDYIKLCARAAASNGKVLRWSSPSGLPWANRYLQPKTETLNLALGGKGFTRTVADGHTSVLIKSEITRGAAPNFVHALDAAHLVRAVNACSAEGIHNLLTVHDCFACSIPQARDVLNIIRKEFVRMYEEHDPLLEIRESTLNCLGGLASKLLPEPPARGSFDIRDVEKSAFAFS